ncbi:hypothetical protein DL763_008186 [Monosporascus cannonballus]|nr:hypothetical protein DL763_008186 [Monosporascus cannonballus]
MNMELVLSRGCRHVDWCTIPDTSIEFCRSCGFALICAAGRPAGYTYTDVQAQPRPEDTFDPARSPPPGARSYRYRRLNLAHGRQIRVLALKAGRPNDPLRGELEHVNLQQGPIYEAVSYTWADEKGDDSICRKIQCGHGDQFIGITKNCEAALLRLRKRDADRRLWIDAVCIDQSNIQERNHQVKNMIAIFRSALRVLVFLGEGSPILNRLVDYMSNDTGGQLPQVLDFTSLFRSRWFHRVWVLQEVAVAKSVLVIYGTKQMSWEDFIEHGNLFLRLMAARNFPLVLPPVISYGLRQTAMGDRRLQGKSDLLSLLQVSRNCSCKDARDKVYAIMGLLQDESALPLRADYSPSTTAGWVFLQAAAWHISTTKSLEILSQVDGTSAINMPSWVPDWTRKSPTPLPAQFKELTDFCVPRITSLDGQALSSTVTLNYPLECVLQVTGRRCGTVWTDKRIFGKALVLPNSASGATADDERDPHASYSYETESGFHWLHNPSQNPETQCCDERLDFWRQILSRYHNAIPSNDFEADNTTFRVDIPPAFGGFCSKCFERDKMYRRRIEQATQQAIQQGVTEKAMTQRTTIEQTIERAITETATGKQAMIEKAIEEAFEQTIEQAIEQAMAKRARIKRARTAQVIALLGRTRRAVATTAEMKQDNQEMEWAIRQVSEQVIGQAVTKLAIAKRAMIEKFIKQAIELTMTEGTIAKQAMIKKAIEQAIDAAIDQDMIERAIAGRAMVGMAMGRVMTEMATTKEAMIKAIERAMTETAMTKQSMIGKATEQTTDQDMIKRARTKQAMIEKAIEQAVELMMAMRTVIKQASSELTCCCVSLEPPLGHFDRDKLEEFITKMNRHGMSRRIFGTDHSLGFGPMEIEDWDEVWILEGATVPFILRRVDNHYKLVGACYVHQASQTTDRCSLCSNQTPRKEITLRQGPRQEPRAQPKRSIAARERFMAQTQSSGEETPSTLALPSRLEEVEIR